MGLDFLNEVTTCSENARHRHYAAPGMHYEQKIQPKKIYTIQRHNNIIIYLTDESILYILRHIQI